MDFAAARAAMIESQVRTNDVSDLEVQTAMRAVPREEFVVEAKRNFSYAEVECPTPSGRILWKPRDFSKLAQAARIHAGDKVLVIAGAGGYSAAVFAAMGCSVTILDEVSSEQPGIASIVGDLARPPAGPWDVIFVDGSVEVVPPAWYEGLADGGRLCVVVHQGPLGKAQIFTKSGDNIAPKVAFDTFVPSLEGFQAERSFTF
jgi:protein-L-isoaspartate(D-aspartate) O-methyltransferase